jgi:hypothetical protein
VSGPVRAFILSLSLLASFSVALAEAGDLDAVEQHCGAPGAESKEISPVTNQLERTLIYNNALYLHFEPVGGGWSFTTAWNGHLPMSRAKLEERLPCFRNALTESTTASAGVPSTDPSIAAQTNHLAANDFAFGIPHFGLIVLLVITLIVFLILPSARQRRLKREQSKPVEHIYRQPNLDEYTSSTSVPIARPIERKLE